MQPEQHLGEANTGQLGETKQADSQSELIPRETGKAEREYQADGGDQGGDQGGERGDQGGDQGGYRKMPVVPLGTKSGLGSGGIQDVKLLQRALREGWKLTPEMLSQVPDAMAKLVLGARDERARVNAAKVLVMMHGQNQDQQKHEETGGVNRLDITSGGKPLGGANLSNLSDEELERLIAERERVLPG